MRKWNSGRGAIGLALWFALLPAGCAGNAVGHARDSTSTSTWSPGSHYVVEATLDSVERVVTWLDGVPVQAQAFRASIIRSWGAPIARRPLVSGVALYPPQRPECWDCYQPPPKVSADTSFILYLDSSWTATIGVERGPPSDTEPVYTAQRWLIGDSADQERKRLNHVHPLTNVPVSEAFRSIIDTAAQLAHWPATTDAPSTSEIRIWLGFGLLAPNIAVRLIETPDGSVDGEAILFWSGGREPMYTFAGPTDQAHRYREEWEQRTARLRAYVTESWNCAGRAEASYLEECRVTAMPSVSWDALLHRLDTFSIRELPDQSTLIPSEGMGLDGETLIVEILSPSGEREYTYWSPGGFTSPESRRAGAIAREIHGAVHPKH